MVEMYDFQHEKISFVCVKVNFLSIFLVLNGTGYRTGYGTVYFSPDFSSQRPDPL